MSGASGQNGRNGWAWLYPASAGAAAALAVFCLVVATLLVSSYARLKLSDPLNDPVLLGLRARFAEQPGDERLKEEIRALDLLARRAYFSSQAHVRRGGYLLLGGAALLILLASVAQAARERLPDPARFGALDRVWRGADQQRRLVAIAGGVVVAGAFAAGLLSQGELTREALASSPWRRASAPADSAFVIPADTAESAGTPLRAGASQGTAEPRRHEAADAIWPGFRGPNGQGHAVATNVPAAWDGAAGTGIRWKTKVPRPGWSSPVVWGNRVFLTGADKDHQELYAFDADSGALLWTADTAGLPGAPAQPVEVSGDAGYAAPTPATDGRFVAAVFANGALLCADVQGKRVWGKHLGAPANHYGHSSSLLVHDGRLLVQMDDSERPRLLAFRVANGEALWETKGSAISWASPIVIETDGQTQIVAADSEGVSGYNPADGVRLWRVDCLGGELGPSPASGAGLVFVANLYATAAGIRPGETPEIAWKWDENLPDTASPLFANNLLFLATSSGTLVCLDALQGTVQWEHEFGTGFYASPILANDRVYALDREGVMHILEAAPEFKLVAECPLGEKADATPAFVNGRLYLRGAEHLYCVEGRE